MAACAPASRFPTKVEPYKVGHPQEEARFTSSTIRPGVRPVQSGCIQKNADTPFAPSKERAEQAQDRTPQPAKGSDQAGNQLLPAQLLSGTECSGKHSEGATAYRRS